MLVCMYMLVRVRVRGQMAQVGEINSQLEVGVVGKVGRYVRWASKQVVAGAGGLGTVVWCGCWVGGWLWWLWGRLFTVGR